MTDIVHTPQDLATGQETISRLVAPRIFASENAADHAALRAALVAELAPRTVYETALAETLVRYQWEIARLMRFRDSALLATYRDLALKAWIKDDPSAFLRDSDASAEDRALIRDLVSADPKVRLEAEQEFRECGWEPADVLGLAYARSPGALKLDDRIADVERRRRILRDDYVQLRISDPGVEIEDAEVLDRAGDD